VSGESTSPERSLGFRAGGWAFDLAVLGLLLSIRWAAQNRGAPDIALLGLDDLPGWWWQVGSLHDWLLVGPDAGNWAANARAWQEGLPLDVHRMPVYTMLAGLGGRWAGDVVFGGHLVNHLLSALVPLVTYALGRLTSTRAVGLGAALLVAWSPELVNNKLHYGVDPTLQLSVALLGLTTWLAMSRGWVWAVVAGVSAGVVAGSHYLGLLFPILPVLLVLAARRSWRVRWIGPLVVAAGCALTWKLLTSPYDGLGLSGVLSVYAEGVAGSDGRSAGGALSLTEAVALVWSRAHNAPALAVQRGLRGLNLTVLPWALLVGSFYLGVLAPGLRRTPGYRWSWDYRPTLLLVGFALPLMALEAARAPDRYALFSRPFLYLIVVRGLCTPAAWADSWIRGRWRRWPAGILGLGLVAGMAALYQGPFVSLWTLSPPTEKGLVERRTGDAVLAEFGPKGPVVTPSQAVPFLSRREACPGSPCARGGGRELAQCISLVLQQCPGRGPLPYLVTKSETAGIGDQPMPDLDGLVAEHFERIGVFRSREATLSLYSVDRVRLAQLRSELQ
jgi:hypothetical protein